MRTRGAAEVYKLLQCAPWVLPIYAKGREGDFAFDQQRRRRRRLCYGKKIFLPQDACAFQFTVGARVKMAASAFLEEALTIDVDESAVNAIVGSLETTSANTPVTLGASLQQTSSDQKQQQQHPNNNKSNNNNNSPNANCSITTVTTITTITNVTTTSSTQMVNSMTVKASPTPTNSLGSQVPLSSVNVVVAGNPSPQSQQQQQQQSQSFINQVANNQVTSNQTNQQISALAIATAAGGANKLTFPTQSNVAQLANGTLGVVTTTTQALLQSTTNAITNVTGGAQTNIKGAPGGMVSVPMSSVPVTVAAANLTAQTQQQQQQGPTQAGVASPAIVPTNVQILNAMRPGTPVAGQQQAKQATRVVTINQTMAGGRAGAPGVCPVCQAFTFFLLTKLILALTFTISLHARSKPCKNIPW